MRPQGLIDPFPEINEQLAGVTELVLGTRVMECRMLMVPLPPTPRISCPLTSGKRMCIVGPEQPLVMMVVQGQAVSNTVGNLLAGLDATRLDPDPPWGSSWITMRSVLISNRVSNPGSRPAHFVINISPIDIFLQPDPFRTRPG